MYEFQYDYIRNKYGSNSRLLLTDTNTLIYDIKTKDFMKIVRKDKEMFDFSNFCLKSKHSKYIFVFKTCWRRPKDMSWRPLQHFFSVTIFCLPRRLLPNTSWRCLKDISQGHFKTFWKMKNCYTEDMSSRCLEDVFEKNKMFTGDTFI